MLKTQITGEKKECKGIVANTILILIRSFQELARRRKFWRFLITQEKDSSLEINCCSPLYRFSVARCHCPHVTNGIRPDMVPTALWDGSAHSFSLLGPGGKNLKIATEKM